MRCNTTSERMGFKLRRRSALSFSYWKRSRRACSILSFASQSGLGSVLPAHSVSPDLANALAARSLMRRVASFRERPVSGIDGRLAKLSPL